MEKIGHLQMAAFGKQILLECGVLLNDGCITIEDRKHVVFTIPDPSVVTMETLKTLNEAACMAGWLVSLDVVSDTIHFMDIDE